MKPLAVRPTLPWYHKNSPVYILAACVECVVYIVNDVSLKKGYNGFSPMGHILCCHNTTGVTLQKNHAWARA